MSNLIIRDLPISEKLDRVALTAIAGGKYGWIMNYMDQSRLSAVSGSAFFITNNYQIQMQNPIIIQNGAGNTGNILNYVNGMQLSAASPQESLSS